MLRINVVTLFPDWFRAPLATSILGRAATATLVQYRVVQLRDYTHDKHQTVDDAPYGGGAGMGLKAEPMVEAVEDLKVVESPIVLLSARGTLFTHDTAVRYSLGRELTLLCGHYKDVDQRVVDVLGAEEVSIGDFVLSGGEPAALCIVDAVVRLLPGALGDHESAARDSHYEGLLAPPSYTRPPSYRGREVPEVLLSGDHEKIAAWRGRLGERPQMGRVREGEKERRQAFEGICIARRGGGINETFTVRKISAGVGVERIFPLHAPSIAEIGLLRQGRVRRPKLYFRRRLPGKAARIREKRGLSTEATTEQAEA